MYRWAKKYYGKDVFLLLKTETNLYLTSYNKEKWKPRLPCNELASLFLITILMSVINPAYSEIKQKLNIFVYRYSILLSEISLGGIKIEGNNGLQKCLKKNSQKLDYSEI